MTMGRRWQLRTEPHSLDRQPVSACSFGVRSPELIFNELDLKHGDCFLDAGCGPGDYALLAADRVGAAGSVVALDRDPFMLKQLQKSIESRGIENVSATLAALGTPLPVADDKVDSCLVSAVLHMPGLADRWDRVFGELHRVLRCTGRLGVFESYQENVAPERPLHLRLTPETIVNEIEPHGFKKGGLVDLEGCFFVWFENL